MPAPIQLAEHPEFPELKLPSEHIDLFSSEYQEGTEEYKMFRRSATGSFKIGEQLEAEQVSALISSPFLEKIEQKKRAFTIPKLEGLNIRSPVLTSTTLALLQTLWAIVVSKAIQRQFPIRRTAVAIFSNPEEDWHQVLLRVFVEANAAQAIAFWDSLESDLQEWVSKLSAHQRLVFLNQVSLRIHWR